MLNIKKIITRVIIPCVLISTFSAVSFAEPSSWAKDSVVSLEIADMVDSNWVKWNRFQEQITREEFADIAVRLYAKAKGVPVDSLASRHKFTDTTNPMVGRAYRLGIVYGTSETTYSPKSLVTREQIATMLYRELSILGIPTSAPSAQVFADVDQISPWAREGINFVRYAGIMSGVGNNMAAPKANATIEQAMVLVDKIAKKYNWIASGDTIALTDSFNGFNIPNQDNTDLMFYEIPEEQVKLRITSGPPQNNSRFEIEHQQRMIYKILTSTNKVSHKAALKASDFAANNWDDVMLRYDVDRPIYINTETGDQTTGTPYWNKYLHIQGTGVINIDYVEK